MRYITLFSRRHPKCIRRGRIPGASLAGLLAIAINPIVASGQNTPPNVHPAIIPARAGFLETSGASGEMTWLIESDVAPIPKITGFEHRLPPHIERRLSNAFDLAQRGAVFTAEGEFRSVLGLCALELDSREGGTVHRDALRQGWIAVDEADQFGGDQLDWRDSADVRRVACGHMTPVLRQAASQVDSIQAVQLYYAYAEERLAFACNGVPGATLAYYGLARTWQVPGTCVSHAAGKAALLHRIALTLAPENVLAANELGVLLAQHGQLDHAEQLFQRCIAIEPKQETWRNLAAVYSRKNDQEASRRALLMAERLKTQEQHSEVVPQQLAENNSTKPSVEKSGIMSRMSFIPKLTNPFRR
jgi:hypothetical protein